MTFAIRTATAADVPAMHAVRCAVRENALSDPARVTEASYAPYIAAGSAWVAVTADHHISGFAALDRTGLSVWALFVAPGHEGAGIGRALHDHMLDWAAERGMDALWLITARGTRAEHFYRKAGWTSMAAADPGETRFEKAMIGTSAMAANRSTPRRPEGR
jgi:GNAT superfamily N-acetyltransferase